ncbi:sirohydrochlorin chelatase [Enemella evansiae]|uniref:sirohydrochlorin chelatase n=1 Tax=Enemella evansiae TaxID=2016499 RepID=UPI000B95FF6D|nr:CbiX/SirB N-terminal domain-containing protein [Enemella evansiae]OYO16921.1 cobalamin biosynthesis protein CbiX [Enemella evansiae]TDO85410.1 sirohydrochlorin ferrochelatase [Enemella evansiae]
MTGWRSAPRPEPVLACAHGTRSVAGRSAIGHLVAGLRDQLADSGTPVRAAFVDVQPPTIDQAMAHALGPRTAEGVRILPLLLSAGYHVGHDLAAAAADHPGAVLAPALGPDPVIADLLVHRLAEALTAAGTTLHPDDAVTVVSAGSSDARARADCEVTTALVAERLEHRVATTWLSAADPRLGDWVTAQRSTGRRTVVLTHLLAPGFFADLARRSAPDLITDPLCRPRGATDPGLIALAARRLSDPVIPA